MIMFPDKKTLLFIYFFLIIINPLKAQRLNEELFKKADSYYKNKEYEKAKNIFENLIKEKEFHQREDILYRLGRCYFFIKLDKEGYNTLMQLMTEYPQTQYENDSLHLVVDYLTQTQEYAEAINLLFIANQKNRLDENLKNKLLNLYELEKNYSMALNFLENNFSPSPWFMDKKIFYLKAMKEYDKAIAYIKQNLNNNKKELYSALGDLYALKSDFKSAISWYNQLYEKTKNIDDLLLELKMLLIYNQKEDSRILVNKILELLGKNQYAYQKISDLYKQLGFYSELIFIYNEAIKEGHNFTKEKINVYEVLGQYDKAVEEYIQLLNPNEFQYVYERLVNLSLVEEEFDFLMKMLPKLETKYSEKKGLIIQLEILLLLKFKKSEMVASSLDKYLKLKSLETSFLENVINTLYKQKGYEIINQIYKKLTHEDKKTISPLMQLRYAQSLYLLNDFQDSLLLLNELNQDVIKEEVDFYRALNYIQLKKEDLALAILKDHRYHYLFFDQLFSLYLKKGDLTTAQKELDLVQNKLTKSQVLYFEILLYLYKEEFTLHLNDVNKYVSLYPNLEPTNDLMLYLLVTSQNEVKENPQNQKFVMEFFKSYFLDNPAVLIQKNLSENNTLNPKTKNILEFFIAKSYVLLKKYNKAIALSNTLIETQGLLRPYALELLGLLYYQELNNPSMGKKYFNIILSDYPNFVNINNIRKLLLRAM